MSTLRLLAISSLVLAGCAAPSQTPFQSSTAKGKGYETVGEAVKNSNPDDIVCTQEKKIGSNMKTTNCMTAQQRQEQAKRSQEAVERRQRSGASDGINDRR